MGAENAVLSFKLSVILHQRRPGHGHKEVQANASVRAAFAHTLGDLLQSIRVLTSALIIYSKVICLISPTVVVILYTNRIEVDPPILT